MTELHDDDNRPRNVIAFRGRSDAHVRQDELELADQPEDLAPADDQPGGQDKQPGTELVLDESIDAEIVAEDETPRQPVKGAARAARRVGEVARQVRQHEPTVRASKAAGRHTMYVLAGAVVLVKRRSDKRSLYERQIRAAEAAGDREELKEWEARREQHKERRHKRLMEALAIPGRLAKALAIAIPVGGLLLLLIGLALAINAGDLGRILEPLVGTVSAIGWLAAAVMWLAAVLAVLAPALAVLALWALGRKADVAPAFRKPSEPADGDVMDGLPDERMIVEALRHTVPALDKAIKAGWRMYYEMPPMIDGKGWRAQLALPQAAPVEEFVKRKTMLAHNLRRYPIEVWPTEPKPAVLDLWVAKPGALSGPVETWPLLKDLDTARSDYFKGVPVGVTIKGDVINGRLFEANWVAGGMMGSGKSTLVITALLGAMLDPLVDIDVVVMADNADYDPMKPRLDRLVTGAGDQSVEQCMAMLIERFEDLAVRGAALREHDERAVTREIAEKDPRLRPRIMVIDECQNLFIGEYGKDAIEVTTKVMSTARKYAITLMFLTPEPSKDALPRKLISIASNKACYAIGDHQGNDAVLGSGSYKAGISAVGLTPKTDDGPGDVGTCMQRGFTGRPGLMRGFYPTQSDAHRVTQRALALRNGRQRRLTAAPTPEVRDLLADVAEVLGTEEVRAADVPRLLATAFPHHAPYRRMTGVEVAARLTAEGVQVPNTGNVHRVRPDAVRKALRARGA